MSSRVRKNYPFIRLIVKTAKVSLLLAKRLLADAGGERMMSLAELIVNVLKGNLKISSKTQDVLSRSKVILRKLAKVRRPSHAIQLFNKHYKTVVTFLKHCLPYVNICLKGKSPRRTLENINSDSSQESSDSSIDEDDVDDSSDEYDTASESMNTSRDSSITEDSDTSDTSMESHSSSSLSYKDYRHPTNELTKAKLNYNEVDMCNDHCSQSLRDIQGPPDYYESPGKRKAVSLSGTMSGLKKPKTDNSVFESMVESQSSQSSQSSESSQCFRRK